MEAPAIWPMWSKSRDTSCVYRVALVFRIVRLLPNASINVNIAFSFSTEMWSVKQLYLCKTLNRECNISWADGVWATIKPYQHEQQCICSPFLLHLFHIKNICHWEPTQYVRHGTFMSCTYTWYLQDFSTVVPPLLVAILNTDHPL